VGDCVSVKYPCPYNHFTVGPHCRVTVSTTGGVRGAGGCPTIRTWIIPAAAVEIGSVLGCYSSPDNHFKASPYCLVTGSCRRRVRGACSCPAIGAGIVSPARIQVVVIAS